MDRTLLVLLAEAWKSGDQGAVAALVDRWVNLDERCARLRERSRVLRGQAETLRIIASRAVTRAKEAMRGLLAVAVSGEKPAAEGKGKKGKKGKGSEMSEGA